MINKSFHKVLIFHIVLYVLIQIYIFFDLKHFLKLKKENYVFSKVYIPLIFLLK